MEEIFMENHQEINYIKDIKCMQTRISSLASIENISGVYDKNKLDKQERNTCKIIGAERYKSRKWSVF